MKKKLKKLTVLLCGNPIDGLEVWGPFDSPEEAGEYASNDSYFDGGDWWTAEVNRP